MNMKTIQSRRNQKISKIDSTIELNINYEEVDSKDIYGYYILNRMEESRYYGLAMVGDFHNVYPDYIALFNQKCYFNKTSNTCVAFYINDLIFDDLDGLYLAIIYKDAELLKYYKWYLQGVKYLIGPDYSVYGNFKKSTIIHQIEKETIVIGWLVLELNVIVYPNITFGFQETFDFCLGNIYYGSNVALSLKGSCESTINKDILKAAIKELVDKIKPKAIIIYAVCSNNTVSNLLEYAINNKIKLVIPNNSLRSSNLKRLKSYGEESLF